MGIAESEHPTTDPRVLRRVRLLGIVELVLTALLLAGMWKAFG
jgi:hypothetical protein